MDTHTDLKNNQDGHTGNTDGTHRWNTQERWNTQMGHTGKTDTLMEHTGKMETQMEHTEKDGQTPSHTGLQLQVTFTRLLLFM